MKTIIPTLLLLILVSCTNNRKFPEVKDLSVYKNTSFNPTLEHKISSDKNHVYCATLLLAWDEVRKQMAPPLTVPEDFYDLKMLDQSTSYMEVLKPDEYDAFGGRTDTLITARAEFNKSLPFEINLNSYTDRLVFDNQKVSSFGVTPNDSYEQRKIVRIIYYKNDHNFAIKLLPEDKQHEIVLFMTEQNFNTLGEMTNELGKLAEAGNNERKIEKTQWKYSFADDDEVVIPKFNFNIETRFETMEGNFFSDIKQQFQIVEARQRTAFILDEAGAEVESEAEFEAATEEMEVEGPRQQKKMVFDQPFFILLQRTDTKNPYFVLWVANAELMVGE